MVCVCLSLGGTKTAKIMVQKQQKMYTFVHSMVVLSVSLGGTKTAKIMVQKQQKCTHLYIPWSVSVSVFGWYKNSKKSAHFVHSMVCVFGWYKNSKIYTFCTFHGLSLSVSLGGTKTAKSTHFVHSMVCLCLCLWVVQKQQMSQFG